VAELGKIDLIELGPGEVLEIGTPCGAGFGDPLARDPLIVLANLLDGMVSEHEARELYGVVPGNDEATRALRLRFAAERQPPPDLWAGPEREAFEAVWTDGLQAAVNEALWRVPVGLRWILREELERRVGEDGALAPADVARLAQEVLADLGRAAYT
jgi:N-methylhydantoinase B